MKINIFSDLLLILGMVMLTIGAALFSTPLGFIVGGICAIVLALLVNLGGDSDAA